MYMYDKWKDSNSQNDIWQYLTWKHNQIHKFWHQFICQGETMQIHMVHGGQEHGEKVSQNGRLGDTLQSLKMSLSLFFEIMDDIVTGC